MKEKTIKTEKVLAVYNIIGKCKYTKMDDDDKIKMWKAVRSIRPIAEQFDEDCKDAKEKLRSDEYKAKEIEMAKYEQEEMAKYGTVSNRAQEQAFVMSLIAKNKDYADYQKKVAEMNALIHKAVKELAEKEVTVSFEPLSDDAFGKLMASNEWTMTQVQTVGDFLTE